MGEISTMMARVPERGPDGRGTSSWAPLKSPPARLAKPFLLAALANYTAASSRLVEVADACARAADAMTSRGR
jgi:hypothetical protein